VWALLFGVLFQGVLGTYQGIIGRPLGLSFLGEPSQLFFGRSLGTVGHPNSYAVYMATTMPIAFAVLFLNIRWFYKASAGIILCFGALGLLFSLSRSGWLGFVVASTVIIMFAIYRRRQNFHINFRVAGSLIFLLLLLALVQRELIVDRLTSSQATASAYSRVTMAQGAIAMIQDYPILGVGANNYSLYMPKYDPFDFKRENQIVIVHNVYLLTAAETGLVGLAVFLWFLVSLFIQSIRVASRATDDIVWLAGVGVFSAFAALSVHGIVEYDMLANVIVFRLFWLFAAIVAGLSENLKRERSDLSQVESGGLHA
jgi:O-antigen ligase